MGHSILPNTLRFNPRRKGIQRNTIQRKGGRVMDVEKLIKLLELVPDKSIPVRILRDEDEDLENHWVYTLDIDGNELIIKGGE